ncbi:MAG: ABC transporter substrate-binding protein [Acetobacter sp.]|nr:ABC transporter substrate-binding protein [Acetobacter sp.]
MNFRFRRRLLPAVVTGLLVLITGTKANAAPSAADFVRNLGNQLVTIVNNDSPTAQKKEQILPILQKGVDVDAIGRFCLGRYWRVATPDEQAEYLALFHKVLVNSITSKLGDYRGVSFTIGTTTQRGDDEAVAATLKRPQQPDTTMQWIVSTESGSPKIVDVIGEGASLRLTQRQDYASYISRNGGKVANLIEALKRQISRNSN